MTSDFETLAEKINQLAELTAALRRENGELRVRNAELTSEQGVMHERLKQARERIAGLIASFPVAALQEERGAE